MHLTVVRMKGDCQMSETKERILNVSLSLFSEKGYSAVSIRDICKEVEIKESSIYYHFKNKHAIFEELLSRFQNKADSMMGHLASQLTGETEPLGETKFVKGVFCSSVIVATRYSSCVCGLHRELRTCGDFYAARLYSTTPARAAPAMTLMGLGFHLRRTKKPARKITRAIRSKLPKSAGRVRWP